MKSTICAIAAVLLCIGVSSVAAIQCYMCVQRDNPVWSHCWNASSTLPTVECEDSCFTSVFQSGGNSLGNYWNVIRGCSKTCSHSDNCQSQHYGKCEFCCSGELCNNYVKMSATTTKMSLFLSVVCVIGAIWLS